ncbi:MAG: hypothetical protein HY902_16130 [Deltaproteobacteria bacterium]|nr:hypothetical protein [Deltaproteobacteria bacterium]
MVASGCGKGTEDGAAETQAAADASGTAVDPSKGAPTPDSACTVIAVKTWQAFGPTSIRGTTEAGQVVQLTLRTDAKKVQAKGTYDLAAEIGAGCTHCLAVSDAKSPTVWTASRGTLALEQVGNPPTAGLSGSVAGVRFDFTATDAKGTGFVVPGGACFLLASASFDLKGTAGAACTTSDDCGTSDAFACDPVTRTCSASVRCEPAKDNPCPGDSLCLPQGESLDVWACYPGCKNPRSKDTCPGDTVCTLDPESGEGMCLALGKGVADGPCKPSDVDTGCVQDYFCAREPHGAFCRKTCDFTAPDPGCPAGQACNFDSLCAAAPANTPKLDAPCPAGKAVAEADQLIYCGLDGGVFRGACQPDGPDSEKATCRRICQQDGTGSDRTPRRGEAGAWQCPAGQVCFDAFDEGYEAGALGLCEPE